MSSAAAHLTARIQSGDHSLEITIVDYALKRRASQRARFEGLTGQLERRGIRVSEDGADDYSANDLDVHIDGSDGTSQWIMDGNFMMTWEIRDLAEWLVLVAKGAKPKWGFAGVDGYPEFRLSDDRSWLEVTVQQNELYSEEEHSMTWGELRFAYDSKQFTQLAEALEREVALFPIRPVQPDGPAAKAIARFAVPFEARDLPPGFVTGPTDSY